MRPNKLWTRPHNGAARTKAPVVNGIVVGPFEEEEEVTSIASDVVEVEDEDPATKVCLRETGGGGTPAILNRGCVPPWLARGFRQETPGP